MTASDRGMVLRDADMLGGQIRYRYELYDDAARYGIVRYLSDYRITDIWIDGQQVKRDGRYLREANLEIIGQIDHDIRERCR